jgi:hypothetical protein
MNLPPDPDEMNYQRAGWANAALVAFANQTGQSVEELDDGTVMADLLTNLMHWCDRNGVNFTAQLDAAVRMYREETAPPAPVPVAVPLTAARFRQAYIIAHEMGGDSWTEESLESSWQAYTRNPGAHFLSKP